MVAMSVIIEYIIIINLSEFWRSAIVLAYQFLSETLDFEGKLAISRTSQVCLLLSSSSAAMFFIKMEPICNL